MCCFSANVTFVESTRIFARAGEGRAQYLAYEMSYRARQELAMILPLPTPSPAAEDAVRFIDLSGYPGFFSDMEKGFPVEVRDPFPDLSAARLKVHDVGSYEASFIPRLADFSRLDERFRLPEGVCKKLPQYADWSFCVFKLKLDANKVHPMAFEFPRRDPARLFFPTVHVHDGTVKDKVLFDHLLYCQGERAPQGWLSSHAVPEGWLEWQEADSAKPRAVDGGGPTEYRDRLRIYRSRAERERPVPAREFMSVVNAKGLIDGVQPLRRMVLEGFLPNQDHYL